MKTNCNHRSADPSPTRSAPAEEGPPASTSPRSVLDRAGSARADGGVSGLITTPPSSGPGGRPLHVAPDRGRRTEQGSTAAASPMGWPMPGGPGLEAAARAIIPPAAGRAGAALPLGLTSLATLALVAPTCLGARAAQDLADTPGCSASAMADPAGAAACSRFDTSRQSHPMAPIELSEVAPATWDSAPASPSELERRVDRLERRVRGQRPGLDERQPVTVLRGESIFGLEALSNLTRIDGKPSSGDNFYIGYRLRLNIDTSFYGEDRLRIRLQSRTLPELEDITGSPLTNLSFDGDSLGLVEVSDLWYRFPIGKRMEVNITAVGGSLRDNVPQINPLFYGSSRGSISVFGSEDPIVRSRSGAALGVSFDMTKQLNLSAAAISSRPDDNDYGILGDRNAQIVQVTYAPSKAFRSAVALTRTLNDGLLSGEFNDSETVLGTSLSGEMFYQITNHFALGLRGGLTETTAVDLPGTPRKLIKSYALMIGFPNLFGKENLLGFVLGRPPAVTYDEVDNTPDDESGHLEMFYRYTITDQLSITPGVMYIIAPDDFGGSQQYWIGALRMTFRF